jgi:hypothetical protein
MMKSVMAVENREEWFGRRGLRLFTFVAGVFLWSLLLSGCNWRQPGQTSAEVERQHDRMLRLNTEMMMSDLDRVLLLDRPSMLTDKELP